MKNNMYSKENVKDTIFQIQRYFIRLYEKKYSVQEIINAFNSLSMKYQDLLLKPDKNENDMAMLRFPYNDLWLYLLHNKESKEERIRIKSLETLRKENEKKKEIKISSLINDYLDKVKMLEDDKLILLYKYEDNKSDNEICEDFGISVDIIREIENEFLKLVKESKVYKLEADK